MPVLQSSGTQSASISTEHSLATVTAAGTYVLVVDLNNLANGDTVELRIKTKVLTGSTARLAYMTTYVNAQSEPNVYSLPVPSPYSFEATLKQVAGSGRSFDWAIYAL